MAIANTVENYLQSNRISYSVVPHPHTWSNKESAQSAHVPVGQMAKAVVLVDKEGYLMVVLLSDRHVDLLMLSQALGRDLTLAPEYRIATIFTDCELGAIPPLGPAYGVTTLLDDSLVGQSEIYFEAGDHEEVICVDGEQFLVLLNKAMHGQFSH